MKHEDEGPREDDEERSRDEPPSEQEHDGSQEDEKGPEPRSRPKIEHERERKDEEGKQDENRSQRGRRPTNHRVGGQLGPDRSLHDPPDEDEYAPHPEDRAHGRRPVVAQRHRGSSSLLSIRLSASLPVAYDSLRPQLRREQPTPFERPLEHGCGGSERRERSAVDLKAIAREAQEASVVSRKLSDGGALFPASVEEVCHEDVPAGLHGGVIATSEQVGGVANRGELERERPPPRPSLDLRNQCPTCAASCCDQLSTNRPVRAGFHVGVALKSPGRAHQEELLGRVEVAQSCPGCKVTVLPLRDESGKRVVGWRWPDGRELRLESNLPRPDGAPAPPSEASGSQTSV